MYTLFCLSGIIGERNREKGKLPWIEQLLLDVFSIRTRDWLQHSHPETQPLGGAI